MGSATNLEDIAVGYNNEDCLEIDSGIEEVYSASITSIQNHFKSDLVDKVATEWYSEVAVSYFAKWQGLCANTSDDLHMVFQNFRDQIQENINNWRTQTGSSGIDLQNIIMKTISIDISSIKTVDDSGNRYISNTIEDSLSGWINTCRANIISDISAKVARKTVGGFIGENQNAAINNALSGLAVIIDNILRFLDTGENSLYNAISEYRKKYTQTGNDVSENTKNNDYTEGVDVEGINSPSTSSSNAGGSGSGNPGTEFGNQGISSSNPGIGSGNPATVKPPKFSDSMGNDLADENINANTPNSQKVSINFTSKVSDDDVSNIREQEKQRLRDLGIDPTDMEMNPFYYDSETGRLLTPTEKFQNIKKEFNDSPDAIRMVNRSGAQFAVGTMNSLEKITDAALGAYILATGSETAAKFASQDLTAGLQNVFDDIYTDYKGNKYKTPVGKNIGFLSENITRGLVETYWYMQLQAFAADPKNFKVIKGAYAAGLSIGTSVDKDVETALKNDGNLRVAAATGITMGGAKQAIASSIDVLGDKTIAEYIPDEAKLTQGIAHATFSTATATGQEVVEQVETAIVKREQKSNAETAKNIFLKKAGKTLFFDLLELNYDVDDINSINGYSSTAFEKMIGNAAINQLIGEAKILDFFTNNIPQ